MIEDILIPIVAMLSICTTIFALYYLRNKENMALIEKGMNPRFSPEEPRRFSALKYGLTCAGGGLGLLVAFLIERGIAKEYVEKYPYKDDSGMIAERVMRHTEDFPQLYFAFIILGAGIGLVCAYLIMRKEVKEK
jgi:hypothetical protein